MSNYDRMIKLADDVFASRKDPNQLNVDQAVMERLQKLHPSSLNEYDNGEGPLAWILVFPTTTDLMNRFVKKAISEKELFDLTPLDAQYDALYLCSALVLEEYRGRGIAKKLTLQAIENIRKDHHIKALFVWAFSRAGEVLSENLAMHAGLPLLKRADQSG